jgi:hypothetical protein
MEGATEGGMEGATEGGMEGATEGDDDTGTKSDNIITGTSPSDLVVIPSFPDLKK